MIDESLLIEPYLCEDYGLSYTINNSKYELISTICIKLTKIKSFMEKFRKELEESKLLKEKITSFKNESQFLDFFLLIQQLIDTIFKENYDMINKIIGYLTELKESFNSYFKKYEDYLNIQKNFINKLVDIDNYKDIFLNSAKKAELFTYEFLKNKAFNNKTKNQNGYQEKEELKNLVKIELNKYKSFIHQGNNELKIFNEKQKEFYRCEKELIMKYNDIYSTSMMTSLEHQLKIEPFSNKIKANIVKLNNKNNKLIDYLKNFKPKEEIDFVPYRTYLEFENCNDDLELSVCFMAYNEIASIIGKYKDIELLNETKRLGISKEINKILNLDEKITEENLEKLKELIESDLGQIVFLKQLSLLRSNGIYEKSEKFIISMGKILNIILGYAENEKNYDKVKNCIILSQTFYYLDLNKEKKYIFTLIKDNKWLKGSKFWRDFIGSMIEIEIKKINSFKTQNLNDILFSQLLPYINNMIGFGLDNRIIIKIVDEFLEKYKYLNKESYDSLFTIISPDKKKIEQYRKEYKENPNLENELYNYEDKNKNENLFKKEKEEEINQNENKIEENIDYEIIGLKNGIN